MRRLILALVMLVSLAACDKKDNTSPNPTSGNNTTDQWGENYFKLNDNGKIYEAKGSFVSCATYSYFGKTSCYISVEENDLHGFRIDINADKEGSDRVGQYWGKYVKSINTSYDAFSINVGVKNEPWLIDSVMVDITSSVRKEDFSDWIRDKGTFKIWVHGVYDNENVKKVLTGEFDTW